MVVSPGILTAVVLAQQALSMGQKTYNSWGTDLLMNLPKFMDNLIFLLLCQLMNHGGDERGVGLRIADRREERSRPWGCSATKWG